jgi:hypothetical protein
MVADEETLVKVCGPVEMDVTDLESSPFESRLFTGNCFCLTADIELKWAVYFREV